VVVRPKSLITAWTLVLALLFGQVGLNLMHTHQGRPAEAQVALSDSTDNGTTLCKACAIDGMPVLYSESISTFLLEFSGEFIAAPRFGGIVLSISSALRGRAPPVC
jgi:hypothetical protein